MKNMKLKQDLVIPAGTVFSAGPRKAEYADGSVVQAVIGVDADTCLTLTGFTSDASFVDMLEECE